MCLRHVYGISASASVVLFYGLESCPLSKSQTKSPDFAINSAFSKIFSTKSQDIIDNCRTVFNCQPLAESLSTRKTNVFSKYIYSGNIICRILVTKAATIDLFSLRKLVS